MTQYIDKSALVAEIQKLYDKDYLYLPSNIYELKDDLLAIIDELEVKEIDLEKELSYEDYIGFFKEHPNFSDDWGFDEAWIFAKYFFELGLKTQKGE